MVNILKCLYMYVIWCLRHSNRIAHPKIPEKHIYSCIRVKSNQMCKSEAYNITTGFSVEARKCDNKHRLIKDDE